MPDLTDRSRRFAGFSEITSFLWSVADLLRGDYKQADYGKVILPFTVLRRLDCVLADTREAVWKKRDSLKGSAITEPEKILNRASKVGFHNVSKFDFLKLKGDPNHLAHNLAAYIRGFSSNARDVIYHGFRCGILQQAHIPPYGAIAPGASDAVTQEPHGPVKYKKSGADCPCVVLDPLALLRDLEAAFAVYLLDLKDRDPKNIPLRSNFRRKFSSQPKRICATPPKHCNSSVRQRLPQQPPTLRALCSNTAIAPGG